MALASGVNLEIIVKIGCKQVDEQSGFDHHRITLDSCRPTAVIHCAFQAEGRDRFGFLKLVCYGDKNPILL
uniref:Uncharacterized protein n=1 Tax=Cyanothece sp. (strain PCC 7425 / ATCC 29141) TaxID=395961 RepID=B8HTA0_CYAP4